MTARPEASRTESVRPEAARTEAAPPESVPTEAIAAPVVSIPDELVAPATTGSPWRRDLSDVAEDLLPPAAEGVAPPVTPPAPIAALPELPDVDEEPRGAGWCAQCGALLSASDIFCGECGFVRQQSARPRDTEILDPFPWGIDPLGARAELAETATANLPAPSSGERPIALPGAVTGFDVGNAATGLEPDLVAGHGEEIDDLDDTRIVAPGARGDRFILQFSTGESVTVTGTGLLGRNPVAEPGEYVDAMVTVSDPGRSVSKTHLEFGQEGGSFWVSDRYSGNGTVVREPERPARRCDPGKRYRIARGTRVDIGEQFFIVS